MKKAMPVGPLHLSISEASKQGFTLVELLVVISIIGLLSSIVYVSLKNARYKAKIAAGLSFSQSLYNVLGAEAVGVWSFETVNGNQTPDGLGNGNNGTIYGNPVQEDSGIPALGKAMRFDGMDDYIDIGDKDSLDMGTSDFTIEAWVKMTLSNERTVASKYYYSGYPGYLMGTVDGKVQGFIRDTDSFKRSTQDGVSVNDGKWHHIAVVFDRDSYMTRYVDGQQTGTQDDITAQSGSVTNDRLFQIGKWDWASTLFFSGAIDEVRIYRQAMTSAQIQKHYAEGLERFALVKN